MSSTDDINAIAEGKKAAGNAAFASKDYSEAIRLYTEAIQLNDSNHVYYSNRSACYASLGQHDEAAKDAQKCIELNPAFVKGYYRLSAAQLELGEVDKALEAVTEGLKKEPSNADLTRQLRVVKGKKAAAASKARQGGGGAPGGLDKQTFEEIRELSDQSEVTQRELAEVSANLQGCLRDQRRAQLTKTEVAGLGGDARLYRSVGKVFMLNSKKEIDTLLDAQATERAKSEEQLKGKKAYLENRLNSQKTNLNELLRQANVPQRS
ncbi:hypothetical protein JKP88DRAFT_267900 [Tribonema minus]|uniref:Hsp70-Hsp90 organising protein n=1 Tax=Tribonema minus TaxID=303371 RepID=A0A835Z4N5_9STRA|nr:hypothetical protein JKP88DRAFT_267900 [Tribonema minus]